jgi:hypothetical protein
LLKKLRVRIPFATKLLLPATKLVARRAFPQLLGFIEAVALLRQFQKKVYDDGHIDAVAKDYEIAHRLMVPVLLRTFAPLSQRALNLLGKIRQNNPAGHHFDRTDCANWAGVGLTEVRNRLTLLVDAGMIEQVTGGKGVRYTYKIVSTVSATVPSLTGLITPEELLKKLEQEKAKKKSKGSPKQSKSSPKQSKKKCHLDLSEED